MKYIKLFEAFNYAHNRGNQKEDIEALLEDLTDEQFIKDLCIEDEQGRLNVDYNIDTETRSDGRDGELTMFTLEITNPKPEAIQSINNKEEHVKLTAPLKEWAKKNSLYVEIVELSADEKEQKIYIGLTEYVDDDPDKEYLEDDRDEE